MKKIFNEVHKKWIKENAMGVGNEELTKTGVIISKLIDKTNKLNRK